MNINSIGTGWLNELGSWNT